MATDTPLGTPTAAEVPPSDDVVYVLLASRCLPSINPTKTVKQVVFSPRQLTRFNRWIRRWRFWHSPGYWLGVALATCTLFLPARIGVWLAVCSLPLQLVPSLISLLAMRFDMAVLVVRGYEFWYLTLSNVTVSTLISFSFNDARLLVLVGAAVAFETALLLDANHRASRLVSFATVLGALTNVAYLACATSGVIEYGRDLELVRYKHHTLYADDVTANLIATLVVLLLRNGVRKFSHTTSDTRMTQCITYRCRLAVVPVTHQRSLPPMPHLLRQTSSRTATVARQLIPLEYVPDSLACSTADILLPRLLRVQLPSAIMRVYSWFLQLASWGSFTGWVIAALVSDPILVHTAALASLCGAVIVCFSYLAFVQRQLLSRLFTSFDFLFLSVQFTATHVCLADILDWSHPRVFVVLSSWLWTHWVLLLDAVLPFHKAPGYLRFCPRVASVVLLLFIAEQLLVSLAIVFLDNDSDPRLHLHDRIVFTLPLRGRDKEQRVVPLLVGRMVATLSWSFRLLWRLWEREANECLLLQGRVQYENTTPFSSMVSSIEWLRKRTTLVHVMPHRL